ncbi:MAG: hypothetical protein V8S32_01285 [Lachnospiraceae bacterium]
MAEELRTVMPLIGSSFEPGQAKNTVKNIKDRELADIAQAELFYFSGQAEACSQAVEAYLESRDDSLRLSACLLYTFFESDVGKYSSRAERAGRHRADDEENIRGRDSRMVSGFQCFFRRI